MTKQPQQRPTAKIYTFPARARASPDSRRQAVQPAQQQAAQLPTIEFGGAWYHQAALEEADEARDYHHQQH